MVTKSVDLVYLGNVSTLINTDPSDYNTENAAALFGTYGSETAPIWEQGLVESDDLINDVDNSTTIWGRNPSDPVDQINGIDVNGFSAYHYTITYTDGTTESSDAIFVQLENGDVYLLQGNGESDDDTQEPGSPWEAKPIQSVELTAVANPDAEGEYSSGGVSMSFITGVDLAVCFASGSLIETKHGPVAVEALQPGDLVRTMDHGYQPIRWIGHKHLTSEMLAANPKLRPIRIRTGALGESMPERDLIVSPQHRVLLRSAAAQRMFGADEVLAGAKHLLELEGVEIAKDMTEVTYVHFLCEGHEIVFSEGAMTESLYPGPEALKSLGSAALEEVYALFPELRDHAGTPMEPARRLLKGREARNMVARHARNDCGSFLDTVV